MKLDQPHFIDGRWVAGQGELTLGHSLFCEVREPVGHPLCGFYTAGVAAVLAAVTVSVSFFSSFFTHPRGVIDSVAMPHARRVAAWDRVAAELDLSLLDEMTGGCALEDIPAQAKAILKGQVKGRLVIDIG